jgi:hypothetical protein
MLSVSCHQSSRTEKCLQSPFERAKHTRVYSQKLQNDVFQPPMMSVSAQNHRSESWFLGALM